MNYTLFILALVLAYLMGNISPSTILAKARGLDIKKEGSGNAGTTNALRVMGKKAALITLIIDAGKGWLAVFIARQFLPDKLAFFCALAVFVGHVWPAIYKFKGGKGVATAFGTLLAINWQLALICLGIVALMVIIFKMVSLGSITAALVFPVLAWFMEPEFLPAGICMALILLFKHRQNIKRILTGTENKISFSKK